MEIIKGLVLLAGSVVSFALLIVGIKILISEKGEYEATRNLTGGIRNALSGRVKTVRGGIRDCRVKAGLAIDKKTNQWVEQGALSEETINSVLY